MLGRTKNRALALAGFALATAAISALAGWLAFGAALDQLDERGRADLALAADRLEGQLLRYREVTVLLSDHPALASLIADPAQDPAAARKLLREIADKTGSDELQVLSRNGTVLAAAEREKAADGATPALTRAGHGSLGAAHYVADGQRFFAFAAPVFEPGGPSLGAVLVTLNIATIEQNWPADPSPVFFSDDAGKVFVSNRDDLVLTLRRLDDEGAAVGHQIFPRHDTRIVGGHALWTLGADRYLPTRALHLSQPMPVVGMTAEILLDLTPALSLALLQAIAAAALCLGFGAMLLLATERLAIAARARDQLEQRVAVRTAELSRTNETLTREVSERKEAEARLKKAQSDLVQAGKLSALGQMSAGISHELNQPLMALRSFAENAHAFLDRGETDKAGQNLDRISDLARRMGRIIKNLRAFARQETETIGNVDLVAVVDAVQELTATRLRDAGVTLRWIAPAHPVWVRAGEVRLQQVVTNLVSNAVDAMESSADKWLEISIEPGSLVRLVVHDNGPGLTQPEKIFDPFYTTKEVGQSEGMGLGLSISYGLVQSFGGAIRGLNRDTGGAVFIVELQPATQEAAA